MKIDNYQDILTKMVQGFFAKKYMRLFALIIFCQLFMIPLGNAQGVVSLVKNVLCYDYSLENNKVYAGVRLDHTLTFQFEVINPNSGITERIIPLNNYPRTIKISDNSEYLYLSFRDTTIISRYQLPSLTWDFDINLPATMHGVDMEIFHNNPEALIVVLHRLGFGPPNEGVVIINGQEIVDEEWDRNLHEIELSDDDTRLYGASRRSSVQSVTTLDIVDYQLSNSTFHSDIINTFYEDLTMSYYNDKLFFDHGKAMDVNVTPLGVTDIYPITDGLGFNRLSINTFSEKIINVGRVEFDLTKLLIVAVDLNNPSNIDTIFIENSELKLPPNFNNSHIVEDVTAKNCENSFMFSLRSPNIINPGFFSRFVIYNNHQTNLVEYICEGDSIFFDDAYLSESGIYLETIDTPNSCDSVTRLELNVIPNEVYLQEIICEGEYLLINGDTITEAGIYSTQLQNQLNCDSINIYEVSLGETVYSVIDTFAAQWDYIFGTYVYEDTTFYLNLTSSIGCDSIVTVNVSLGGMTSNFDLENSKITMFPNPFNETLLIKSEDHTSNLSVAIFSISGSLLLEKEIQNGSDSIDTSKLLSGIYIAAITFEGKTYYQKIIKH